MSTYFPLILVLDLLDPFDFLFTHDDGTWLLLRLLLINILIILGLGKSKSTRLRLNHFTAQLNILLVLFNKNVIWILTSLINQLIN